MGNSDLAQLQFVTKLDIIGPAEELLFWGLGLDLSGSQIDGKVTLREIIPNKASLSGSRYLITPWLNSLKKKHQHCYVCYFTRNTISVE